MVSTGTTGVGLSARQWAGTLYGVGARRSKIRRTLVLESFAVAMMAATLLFSPVAAIMLVASRSVTWLAILAATVAMHYLADRSAEATDQRASVALQFLNQD